ncbi:GMC oxidoreductase [Didymella exigua CBS 183.55]|uniref:GMC oxidoreductase n=1 Tax=Didymella exigua CBS 183.55 TaxID=1150837 RepID=A0A6A5RC93_9PLEO|nr:GMC oxidoreductase [Didymella exigua CBS 183.55]KAF1924694.1 GMC oxidoreductase [Didymella exigua CBS 183.55]
MTVKEFTSKSYDYVVCGGGTAGLVIAARLSEDPNVSVAVLEAGGNGLNDILIDGPNLFTQLWGKPQYDWDYKTVPQEGTVGRVHGWARGKVLGGSSAINYNMFSMASRQDLDNWAELGNQGWDFDGLVPYYKKFEIYHPASETLGKGLSNEYLDKELRGTNGPIHVCFAETDVAPMQDIWPKTVLNAGYKEAEDPRTGSAIGGFNQLNTIDPRHNRRSYAARDYYEPNAGRPNLALQLNALVSKIEFQKDGEEATATGVQFIVDGTTHTVKAKREVIVSGGVINSPQLLELSGIGSRAVLEKAGVEIIVDLPGVGENLNDHTATAAVLGTIDEVPSAEALMRNPEIMQQALQAYIEHKAGPFVGAPTTTGFASLEKIQPNFADAETHIYSLLAEHHNKNPTADPAGRNALLARQLLDPKEAVCQIIGLSTGANLANTDNPSKLFPSEEDGMWMTLGVCSTRSLSRGSVHITSADATVYPTIDPAYFSHPLDVDMMARALLHTLSFMEIEPLKSALRREADGTPVVAKTSGKLPTNLDEAKGFVQANTVTEYHPVGTCAMLPRDKGGVVDHELRVHGTRNVRVCDASIFPLHVQGNIVSLVYAMAEKGADLIKVGANGTNSVNGH